MSDCLFCKIIRKDIPAKAEFQDETVTILRDINPQAPVHVLVLPNKHIESIGKLSESDEALIGKVIYSAKTWAEKSGLKDYRLIFNNGPEAGQTVYHIHLHLLSGRRMSWPPG